MTTPKKKRLSSDNSQPTTPSVVITQEMTAGKRALASRPPISRILADNGIAVDGDRTKSAKKKGKGGVIKTPKKNKKVEVDMEKLVAKTPKSSAKKKKSVVVENGEEVGELKKEPSQTPQRSSKKKMKIDAFNKADVDPGNVEVGDFEPPKSSAKKTKKKKTSEAVDSVPKEVLPTSDNKPMDKPKPSKSSAKKTKKQRNSVTVDVTPLKVPQTGGNDATTLTTSTKKTKSAVANNHDENVRQTIKKSGKKNKTSSEVDTTSESVVIEEEPLRISKNSAKKKKKKSLGVNAESEEVSQTEGDSLKKETNKNIVEQLSKDDVATEGKKRPAPVEADNERKKKRSSLSKRMNSTETNGSETKKVSFANMGSEASQRDEPVPEDGLAALRAARRKGRKQLHKTKGGASKIPSTVKPSEEDGEPRVVYIGHVPHGFYEREMRLYFSQFGDVARLRLSRAKKSGNSRGFAFIEFAFSSAAEAAASAMDGYMMHGRRMKAALVPNSRLHGNVFKGAERRFAPVEHAAKARRQIIARSNDPKALAKRQGAVRKRQRKRLEQLKSAGVHYKVPAVAE